MAFEETLVCDGCSEVLDGGRRGEMVKTLAKRGGRAFTDDLKGQWSEVTDQRLMVTCRRHLGPCCASIPTFFDGTPVPEAQERKDGAA